MDVSAASHAQFRGGRRWSSGLERVEWRNDSREDDVVVADGDAQQSGGEPVRPARILR
jgi:hypothetical protein